MAWTQRCQVAKYFATLAESGKIWTSVAKFENFILPHSKMAKSGKIWTHLAKWKIATFKSGIFDILIYKQWHFSEQILNRQGHGNTLWARSNANNFEYSNQSNVVHLSFLYQVLTIQMRTISWVRMAKNLEWTFVKTSLRFFFCHGLCLRMLWNAKKCNKMGPKMRGGSISGFLESGKMWHFWLPNLAKSPDPSFDAKWHLFGRFFRLWHLRSKIRMPHQNVASLASSDHF